MTNKFEQILLAAQQARLLKYKGYTNHNILDKHSVCVQAWKDVSEGRTTWTSLKKEILKLDIK